MSAEHEDTNDEVERRELERELLAAMEEEMRRIPVGEYLVGLLMSLSSMAFQRLGLTAETADDRDLAQTRLAIDAFSALVDVLAPDRPVDEIALYRSTLHQMRMAYVTAVETEEAAPHEAAQQHPEADTPAAESPDAPAQAADGAETTTLEEDEEA